MYPMTDPVPQTFAPLETVSDPTNRQFESVLALSGPRSYGAVPYDLVVRVFVLEQGPGWFNFSHAENASWLYRMNIPGHTPADATAFKQQFQNAVHSTWNDRLWLAAINPQPDTPP